VKGCEFKPGGSISLGQILVKPFEPSTPLLLPRPLPIAEETIERTYQDSVQLAYTTSFNKSFGLWAELALLPVTAEVVPGMHKSKSESWHFDRLETEIMAPRLVDVKTAMGQDEVVRELNRSKFNFKKRLYMVTGVRIARGARLLRRDSTGIGGEIKVGLDLTAFTAAPISAGPKISVSRTKGTGHSFEEASDFVYAYRVCEIHYGKDVYVKPHNRGDLFRIIEGGSEVDSSYDEWVKKDQRLIVEKIGAVDYTGVGVAHTVSSILLPTQNRDSDGEEEFLLAV